MTRRKRPQSGFPFSESLGKYNTFLMRWKLFIQCDLVLHAATYHSGDMQGALWTRVRHRLWKREHPEHIPNTNTLWLQFLFNVEAHHWDPLFHRRPNNSGPLLNLRSGKPRNGDWVEGSRDSLLPDSNL